MTTGSPLGSPANADGQAEPADGRAVGRQRPPQSGFPVRGTTHGSGADQCARVRPDFPVDPPAGDHRDRGAIRDDIRRPTDTSSSAGAATCRGSSLFVRPRTGGRRAASPLVSAQWFSSVRSTSVISPYQGLNYLWQRRLSLRSLSRELLWADMTHHCRGANCPLRCAAPGKLAMPFVVGESRDATAGRVQFAVLAFSPVADSGIGAFTRFDGWCASPVVGRCVPFRPRWPVGPMSRSSRGVGHRPGPSTRTPCR
jgi:hypothetical protein